MMLIQQDVMIALKNGQTKYGLLLGRSHKQENEIWNFVDYANIKSYSHTKDKSLIENYAKEDIRYIDLDLR